MTEDASIGHWWIDQAHEAPIRNRQSRRHLCQRDWYLSSRQQLAQLSKQTVSLRSDICSVGTYTGRR